MKVRELVHKAQHKQLGLPEIQRGTTWSEKKAAALADTLYRGWPVGAMVFWQSPQSVDVRDRTGHSSSTVSDWVLDGQQRTTALCLLFGVTPYWKDDDHLKVQFHPLEETFRVVTADHPGVSCREDAPKRKGRPPIWVDVADILGAQDGEALKNAVTNMGLSQQQHLSALMNLERLRAIRDREIPVETVDSALEDVSEIFRRVNSAGTKVNAADVTLAVATAHSPGWSSAGIIPLLTKLEVTGFDIQPALLLKTISAVYKGTSRFGRLKASEWAGALENGTPLNRAWIAVRDAWIDLPRYLGQFGTGMSDQLPALSPLVGLVSLRARFPEAYNDSQAFAWVVNAAISGRYASGSEDKINADVAAVALATDFKEALANLNKLITVKTFTEADFTASRLHEDGRSRLFLMWLAAHMRKAVDWKTGERLNWAEGRHPEVHHIFPRDLLARIGRGDEADSLSNLAFITKTTNRSFSADEPETYLARHTVDREVLLAQSITGDGDSLKLTHFNEFRTQRAKSLAEDVNSTLESLAAGFTPEV